MIDLHSHILPGVDDGSPDLETSLAMARMAVDEGIKVMACTPHFMPGMHNNRVADIQTRIDTLNGALIAANIDLPLVMGGDNHIRPDFSAALINKNIPTIHNSRYVLFEPPHVMMPPRLSELLFAILGAGYVPIVTHPERLSWIEQNYPSILRLAESGIWMQVTAGSLTGRFGPRPQYWAQRMLQDGVVHILATDAHNLGSRPPKMSKALAMAAAELGPQEAHHIVVSRPHSVLINLAPEKTIPLPRHTRQPAHHPRQYFTR
jgi:protein-tyrosine phosphatase